ncbi:hypothetical protein VTL71DRAFT_10448 [Oculimacula yallundae]|uniref:Uncharacterized protein n=1 Tax=Oculimacula yallundae TaxID=86028 RepID=A0ABR4CTA3_9HELO
MLPPIDESILQANPRFAALHNTLAKQILNANGSTKVHPAQKERDAVSEALKTSRLRSAKSQFLKSALRNLDLSSTSSSSTVSKPSRQSQSQPPKSQSQTQSLPADLIELILLLTSHLSTPSSSPLPPQSLTILQNSPPWTSLPAYLPKISALLSSHLHSTLLLLCRLLNPSTNASYLHLKIPTLLPSILSLQASTSEKRTSLQNRRLELTSNTTTLLTLHHLATHLIISHLEQTSHGLLSRHIKARSEYLSLRATQLNSETKMKMGKGQKMVYTPEVTGALENYVRELRGGRERGRERKKEAERVLWGYGVGRDRTGEGEGGEKEKVMREVARVYGELSREVREVGRDVERLRGR